jgi:hypothetical protein
LVIGITPKATKAYRKRVASFAHEMVAMIEDMKERQDEPTFTRFDIGGMGCIYGVVENGNR